MANDYNAAERKDVRRATKRAEREAREAAEYVGHIMSTSAGRSFMVELLEACHVFASSFNNNSMRMAFNEGERNIGLRLLANIMRVAADQYVVMMREKEERDAARSSRSAESTTDDTDSDDDDRTFVNDPYAPTVYDRTDG